MFPLCQIPTVYVDPIITGDIELDNVLGHLSFTMKLSLFWQDFRLVIRFVMILRKYFSPPAFQARSEQDRLVPCQL